MLVAAIVLALYFWAYFAAAGSIADALIVSDIAAITAGVAFTAGFASYLWAPKQYAGIGAGIAYALLCVTTALLIIDTGGAGSPFIALWMLVAVFAGVFGWYALGPLFLLTLGYLVLQYIEGALTREAIVTIVLAGELPLIASYIIWHTKAAATSREDKAYQELAAEYSQVSGKSDAVISAIADGVIALDSKGTIQLINPAAQQIVGWGKQDATSLDYKSVLKLLDKNDQELDSATDPITQTLNTNKEVEANDLTLVTHSGKKRQIAITTSPVGQVGAGAIVVFRDITKEKAEEREQAEFISTASHEMRTPVASIEGYLGLALNPATAQIDNKAREYLTKAQQSAQHLGRLFQDLLDISKAEDGRLSNTPKVVDVVAFLGDVVQGLEPKAKAKGLRMLFKPAPDEDSEKGERLLNPVFYANVDNDHLREVFSNLVENAIKYTPSGDITIDVTGDTDHIIISVADSGIGIPKEDQPHLFQKFYRVDNSATREIGGTGLGLYLSRRLTEVMGGRIWLESEFQRGSTFFVELPRLSHEDATRMIEEVNIAPPAIQGVTVQTPATPLEEVPLNASPTSLSPQAAFVRPMATTTPVTVATPSPPQEAVFSSPPAEAVAQQLRQANPAPLQNQPTYPSSATPAPRFQPTQQPRPNIPLAAIEQNPSAFLGSRPSQIPVPPREQNQT